MSLVYSYNLFAVIIPPKDTICEIDSQWEFAVWLRKFKQGLCINYSREVGWGGRCKGGSKGKGYMYTYG